MSKTNENASSDVIEAIDEAYSHGYSEALGGNWKGLPHVHRDDELDVTVGGRYYAYFPEDDKKMHISRIDQQKASLKSIIL